MPLFCFYHFFSAVFVCPTQQRLRLINKKFKKVHLAEYVVDRCVTFIDVNLFRYNRSAAAGLAKTAGRKFVPLLENSSYNCVCNEEFTEKNIEEKYHPVSIP